jgi:hypothetical protein
MKQAILAGVLALAAQLTWATTEQPISLRTATGVIEGSLLTPDQATQPPVVLIIAGSGPTDRDGNSAGLPGKNNSLKLVAQALASQGYASVRFDKRGIAASVAAGPSEADLRFDTYVADTKAWATMLAADARFAGLALLGHSEGAHIAMLAAQGNPTKALVVIAGPASGAAEVLRTQLKGRLPPDLATQNEAILQSLEAGKTVANVPPPLMALYRPSVLPYLVSWFRQVPRQAFAQLQIPSLIVQGETDVQVSVAQAQALLAARPQATLVVVPGMNHVLKLAHGDVQAQMPSYSDPSLPLAPGLADALGRFLGSVFPNAAQAGPQNAKP